MSSLRRFGEFLDKTIQAVYNSLIIPVVGVSFLVIYISLKCYWADSEIWAVSSAGQLFAQFHHFSFGMKPAFNLLLFLMDQVSRATGILPMYVARFFFGLNAVAMIYLVWRITKSLTRNSEIAFVSATLLATSIYFSEQGFRVRSDLAATTCLLLSLHFLFREGHNARKNLLAAIGFLALSFEMTPNAVVAVFAFSPVFYFSVRETLKSEGLKTEKSVQVIRRIFAAISAFIIAGVLYFKTETLESWNFFLESFSIQSTGVAYWSVPRFFYLSRFLKTDLLFAVFLLTFFIASGWIAICSVRTRFALIPPSKDGAQLNHRCQLTILSASALTILLFFHPSKLPFMIASYIPLFAIAAGCLLTLALPKFTAFAGWRTQTLLRILFVVLVIFQTIGISKIANRVTTEHSNSDQANVIRYLNGYFKIFGNPTYYDVIGILPDFPPTSFFIGPGQMRANQEAIQGAKNSNFDFILATEKVRSVGEKLSFYLEKNYIEVSPGIFTRAVDIDRIQFKGIDAGYIDGPVFVAVVENTLKQMGIAAGRFEFQAMNEQMQSITNQIVIRTGGFLPRRLNEDLDNIDLQSPLVKVYFPKTFWRLRVTPYGKPILPTERTLGDLFRFDSEF